MDAQNNPVAVDPARPVYGHDDVTGEEFTTVLPDPPDPELRSLIASLRRMGHPGFHAAGVERSRDFAVQLRKMTPAAPGPSMFAVDDLAVQVGTDAVPLRRYRPLAGRSRGTIVYYHGGGWVVGGIEESDDLCRALARATGCEVVSVGYRLAPEHVFPTAVDDADAAATWIADTSPEGQPLILLGDSAGGTLATVVARRFRDRARTEIALQVLVYPVTDHRMQTKSYVEHAGRLLISGPDMHWFWEQYVPDRELRSSADASPALATDLRGMPPALLLVAEYDPLRDEVLDYARRLSEQGVEVTVDRYDTMAHGFFPLIRALAMSRAAVNSVAIAIQRSLDEGPQHLQTPGRLPYSKSSDEETK
ncbi:MULTISPECIES: alpha/beta hydrolase [unclassified Rhodococcus (in: high G+C Gram-positive bacteria)]|uniref:alpha/beta hydrolase n=1 Tax=unclassified Rhodococcus (in: high G+C Gram-positive bacteria) TaxID=192944 RepID=UPI00163A4B90|nr:MULTISPECIES: alpha/beta hydrolase [unclassified Rhodococcus (in: high G+C Gram-positive bacteria)]MBC2637647.1 alpha/beta hydrolase [Rhodococcus sp. 3A]MBC2897609.1 alpha/beta hydrolase [Rhodococcus sp. 4CII]